MKSVKRIPAAVVFAVASFVGCQQSFAECGIASTYSEGSKTANGEHYNHMGISAAHRSLPFGSRVVVRNQRTGRAITVRINDRGPFVAGRIIDLSTGAKQAIGMDGLAQVCLEVVSYGNGGRGERALEANADGGERRVRHAHHGSHRTARVRYAHHGHHHYAHASEHRGRKRYASN